ncbi:PAS domain S-box protein [Lacihabitans soyangensis]|uniref:histidine kinase n=1 Tax=Lacihabitans soyangensis TaxID=869394 RepID=A0AAE3H313_9BACT|nr:PAS domain S-box protein [Lacihabitans soyangensis]MCP9762991.1 PAS domain S-box protein [Lacihabitans soyangensis]
MEKGSLDIQVLLEIALNQRIVDEVSVDLPKVLHLYLRKLNCFSVAIIHQNEWTNILPKALNTNLEWQNKLNLIKEEWADLVTPTVFRELDEDKFYGFSLDTFGRLVLVRKNVLSDEMIFELKKVVFQLGRDLNRAEEEQRLKLLQSLFDKSSDAIQVANENGSLYYINEVASQRLGISQDEIKKYHVSDFENIFRENENAWALHIEQLRTNGQIILEGININQKTKELIPVEVTVNLITIKNSNFVIAISRDITERRCQETKIKDYNQKLESILNEMTDVVWSIKIPEKEVIFVTPSIESVFEIKADKFLNDFDVWQELIVDEDKYIIEEIYLSLSKIGSFNVKYRIKTENGHIKWIRNKGKYVYNNLNEPIRLDGVAIDRTKEYIAQNTLDQELRLQEALIDIASTYINLDPKDVENTINRSLEMMGLFVSSDRAYIFEYNFEKGTTSNIYEWCNEGIAPEIDNLQDVPNDFFPQWITKHQNGEVFYISDVAALNEKEEGGLKSILEPQGIKSLIALPMLDGQELVGFVGFDSVKKHYNYTEKEKRLLLLFGQMLINIRNRQKWENQLRLQEEKYRNILANMNLGLLEIDLNNAVIFANQSFCDMSGHKLEELKGKSILDLSFSDEYKIAINNHAQKQSERHSEGYEIEFIDKQGESHWWFISNAPNFNDKGHLIGYIIIHLDISVKKRLEQELAKAKTFAESAAKAKELFLANMSHEIRTPLNVIIGMIRQLNKENLTTDQHFYVKQSESSAKHLLTILNNILDIAKIESGDMELIEESFSPSALAYNVHSIMYSQAKDKNIDFKLNVNSDIKPALKGDETRLRQVLINLLGNAIKFTDKGSINLSVELLENYKDSQKLRFEVKDSGIGMSEEFVLRIFDKFSQEQNTSNRKYEGTGLGMAISNDLIKLMGGTLKVTSQKNIGTTCSFDIEFKIADPQSFASIKKQIKAGVFSGKRVLLVEDNEMNRFIAIQSLKFLGFDTTEAENGLVATELIQKQNFDLILMDIQMPVMDGVEATEFIREKLLNNTPIIALTANAFKHDIDLYLRKGMNDFVTKPFDEQDFFRKIEHVLSLSYDILPLELNSKVEIKKEIPLYDLTSLENLLNGDKDYINQMIVIFIDLVKNSSTEMSKAYSEGNFEQVRKIAHKIKPSVEQMGVNSIMDTIKTLEKFDYVERDPSQMQIMVNEIITVLNEVVDSLANRS